MTQEAISKKNRLRERIDAYLDERTERFILASVDTYAKHDEVLAERIRWEVTRRGELGKRLDIYEPARWAAVQTGLSFIMGATIKTCTDKKFSVPALWTLGVSTVLMNCIQLARLLPRYQQGMHGAVETALKLHEKSFSYDPFTTLNTGHGNEKAQCPANHDVHWVDRTHSISASVRMR